MAVWPYPPTGSVYEILGAIQGTGHARRLEHALTTHLAVEQETFDGALAQHERLLQPRVTDAVPHGVELYD